MGGFPLLVDLLILGATQQYVADVKRCAAQWRGPGARLRQPVVGWKRTAHAGIAATVVLNALTAEQVSEVPWHVTPPAVWAVLVELTAAQVLSVARAGDRPVPVGISATQWITAPLESVRIRRLMQRTGIVDAQTARIALGVNAAAREALRLVLPARSGRRVRQLVARQLRTGTLPPAAILGAIGWNGARTSEPDLRPESILRTVLHEVLDPGAEQASTARLPFDLSDIPDLTSVGVLGGDTPAGQNRLSDRVQDSTPYQGLPEAADDHLRDRDFPRTGNGAPAETTVDQDERSSRSTGSRQAAHQRRLDDAIDIMKRQPQITGIELRAELAGKGWVISDRTAARILPYARKGARNTKPSPE